MKLIFSGCLLWVLAAAGVAVITYYCVTCFGKDSRQFAAPGSLELVVPDPGEGRSQTVALWYDYQTFFENKHYSDSDIEGMTAVLRDAQGKELQFVAPVYPSKMTIGATSRRLIGKVEAQPGRYTAQISGIEKPAVFSVVVGDKDQQLVFGLFGVVGGGFILSLGGLALIIVGAVRVARNRRVTGGDDPQEPLEPQRLDP